MTDAEAFAARAGAALERIRARTPLVHHITNLVVMNDTANVTLAVGASPVMAHAPEEVEEMVGQAAALVLNPGTLDAAWIESMRLAGRRARALFRPIVLDPVGAGATAYRTRTNLALLRELRPSIVRGNGGEIGALGGAGGAMRGVDSVEDPADTAEIVRRLAGEWGVVVAVTGARDRLSDGRRAIEVDNGHPWLTGLTGTGCMATAIIGAFAAVEADALCAAAGALACFGLAAEIAAARAQGPGSLRPQLLDALHAMTGAELRAGARLRVE